MTHANGFKTYRQRPISVQTLGNQNQIKEAYSMVVSAVAALRATKQYNHTSVVRTLAHRGVRQHRGIDRYSSVRGRRGSQVHGSRVCC